jgi:hypothetical protein
MTARYLKSARCDVFVVPRNSFAPSIAVILAREVIHPASLVSGLLRGALSLGAHSRDPWAPTRCLATAPLPVLAEI